MQVLHGLVVRIPGFHPGGPGSIPGVGTFGCNRIVVSTSRCGRDNPGSNPGYSTFWLCRILSINETIVIKNEVGTYFTNFNK